MPTNDPNRGRPSIANPPLATPVDDDEDKSPSSLDVSQSRTVDHVPAESTPSLSGSQPTATSSDAVPANAVPGFELLEPLGEGGMGVVYKARQTKLKRVVALKMVLGGRRVGSKELIRFLAEAEAVAAVKHPHVVQVFEYGEYDGRPYLAMEYLPGGSLAQQLKKDGRLGINEAAQIVGKLAAGVQAAHEQGIIHRDLKPGNVLLDQAGDPKITDFGLAKRREGGNLTATQAVMGTPAYMAPEQARGDTKFAGPQADVYSLGVILYECISGDRPFHDANQMALLRKVVEEEPRPLGKLRQRVPRDIELICSKCMAKDPVERYQSAMALAADLQRFASGQPVSVRAAGIAERGYKWVRRNPTRAASVALSLTVLLLAGFGTTIAYLWRTAVKAEGSAVTARDNLDKQNQELDAARLGESKARTAAESALAGESKARNEADLARKQAESERHGRTMEVAHQEWRIGNVAVALGLLDSTKVEHRGWEYDYLKRLCHSDLMTLDGHKGFVNSVAFSADGAELLTGSNDHTVKAWNAKTGALDRTMMSFGNLPVSFSQDRSLVISGRTILNAKTGILQQNLKDFALRGSFSPNGAQAITNGQLGTVVIWDLKSSNAVRTLKYTDAPYPSLDSAWFSPDGSHVITMALDRAKLWNVESGKEVRSFIGGPTQSNPFSPDGSKVVTASRSGTHAVSVWDVKTGNLITDIKGHGDRVNSAVFSADGARLLTGSADGTARIWDVKSARELTAFRGHTASVLSAAFSPDGSRVVTGSEDRTAKVWDVKTGVEYRLHQKGSVLDVSPDGSLSVARDLFYMNANVIDTETGKEVRTLKQKKQEEGSFSAASFSAEGSRIVTASRDQLLRIWDVKTAEAIRTCAGHTKHITSTAFSRDGRYVASGSQDLTARIWNAQTGAPIHTLGEHTGVVYAVAFSPDGTKLVTASADKTARVWDCKTGKRIAMFSGHSASVNCAAFSDDGTWIVTGSGHERPRGLEEVFNPKYAEDDTTARVWDAKTGVESFVLRGHTGAVLSCSFNKQGSRIVTGSDDSTARVWDAKSGAELLILRDGRRKVRFARFSADGTRVFTGHDDSDKRIWDSRAPSSSAKPK